MARRPTLFVSVILAFVGALAARAAPVLPFDPSRNGPLAELPGHVLSALGQATAYDVVPEDDILTVTVVLRRTDEAGFQDFLRDLYDPVSPSYKQFLAPDQIAERFGPSEEDFAAVEAYFRDAGFEVTDRAANRMTMTVSAPHAVAARALGTEIRAYRAGHESFRANSTNPHLPVQVAGRVQAIVGLSDLARPHARPQYAADGTKPRNACETYADDIASYPTVPGDQKAQKWDEAYQACLNEWWRWFFAKKPTEPGDNPYRKKSRAADLAAPAWQTLSGAGQTIGIVAFDTFSLSDIQEYVALLGYDPSLVGNLSTVSVNGGASPGTQQTEVLLDVGIVLTNAWAAKTVVYEAPFHGGGSFQAVFNAMINGGVSIISNSWTYCEDQTTLSDVQSIESVLQTAAAAGISVLSATGDTGSTCWNGSPNTAQVPSTSPHITAVGATSAQIGPGWTYVSESWWDDSGLAPPGGQGGYGLSGFFARPSFQDGFTTAGQRSIPDIAVLGRPSQGFVVCQAAAGGCPVNGLFGGTSSSTPMMAAAVAWLNEAQGTNLGFLNNQFYSLANTDAFHSPASMTSDFAHVGIGSPNLARLHQHLTNQTPGAVSIGVSDVHAFAPEGFYHLDPTMPILAAGDGASIAYVVVRLADANGNLVGGKHVSLSGSPAGNVVISPASGTTTAEDGAVVFTVKNLAAETVTFTATDTDDNAVVQRTAQVMFFVPRAANVSFVASPSSVPADGTSTATLTLTLTDALNRPTPGKSITISQAAGHSIISGPSPSETDANGQIQFVVTDRVGETVTYSAFDVTDNLNVPIQPAVTFTGSGTTCVGQVAQAAPGYTLTPFATGFVSLALSYSNVNWGCQGGYNPTFDKDGTVLVSDFPVGKLYRLPQSGGAVSTANLVGTIGLTLEQPVFGKDGTLYVARGATGSGFSSGVIVAIDPASGAVLRTLASGLTCPSSVMVDPISGDLFYGDTCFGAGADNPSIWRIHNPASASPTTTVYATLPSTPMVGQGAFAPDGTLWIAYGLPLATAPIARIAGTNAPNPGALTTLPNITTSDGVTVALADAAGNAKAFLIIESNALKVVDVSTVPYTKTTLATGATLLSGVIGPDGCVYFSQQDAIYRLAPAAGGCTFLPASTQGELTLAPATVNAAQGGAVPLVATFKNLAVPAGTSVSFISSGANSTARRSATDANGVASASFSGFNSGQDTIFATATVGTATYTSNQAVITWSTGPHVVSVSLVTSRQGGAPNEPATLTAGVTDVSVNPNAPVSGVAVQFSVGPWSCMANTNASGQASCAITPTQAGIFVLTASFAGNGSFAPGATSAAFTVGNPQATIDVDASGASTTYDALTDGLLILRYLFGLRGPSLVAGAVGPTATRVDPVAIATYLDGLLTTLDVDGNGTADALTDGLIVIRYLFGLRGPSLIAGAVGANATRTTAAEIETYIQSLVP